MHDTPSATILQNTVYKRERNERGKRVEEGRDKEMKNVCSEGRQDGGWEGNGRHWRQETCIGEWCWTLKLSHEQFCNHEKKNHWCLNTII